MDAYDSIDSMDIDYDLATTDHIPFHMVLNTGNLPVLLQVGNGIDVRKIDWSKLSNEDLDEYNNHTDVVLGNIIVPKDALLCRDMN